MRRSATLSYLLVTALALLVGFYVGRVQGNRDSAHGPSTAPAKGSAMSRMDSNNGREDEEKRRLAARLTEERFTRVTKMPLTIDRSMELNVLFKDWGRTDPEAALRQAWEMGTANDAYIAFSAIMEGWSENDLPAALNYVRNLAPGPERSKSLLGVIKKWGATDPRAAAEFLLQSGRASDLEMLGPELLAGWGSQSVTDALKWIDGLKLGGSKMKLYAGLAEAWGQKDPKAAMDYFNSQLGMQEAEEVVLKRWAVDDPRSAAEYLNTLPERLAKNYIFQFAHHWSAQDPKSAVNWALSLPDPANRDMAVAAAMSNLQFKDPKAAAQITENYIVGYSESTYVYTSTASAWAQRDPQKASEWVDGLRDPHYKSQAADGLIPSWAKQEPRNAADWLLARQGQVQSGLMEQVIQAWGETQPQQAWEYIKQAPIADPAVKFRSMAKAIDQIFTVDPTRAAQLMEQLPNVDSTAKYYRDVAYKWANYDPKSAAEWIAQLPSNHAHLSSIMQGYKGSIYDGADNLDVSKNY